MNIFEHYIQSLAPSSQKNYRKVVAEYIAFENEIKFKDVQNNQLSGTYLDFITAFIEEKRRLEIAPTTIVSIFSILSLYFQTIHKKILKEELPYRSME